MNDFNPEDGCTCTCENDYLGDECETEKGIMQIVFLIPPTTHSKKK